MQEMAAASREQPDICPEAAEPRARRIPVMRLDMAVPVRISTPEEAEAATGAAEAPPATMRAAAEDPGMLPGSAVVHHITAA